MKYRNFDELIIEELREPEFASTYLQEALEEGGIPLFLIPLKEIVKLKQETELGTESIYQPLWEQTDPHLSTLEEILKSIGMKLTITSQ